MSILDAAIQVADEVGVNRPVSLVTSPNQLARQMFGLLNATQEELCEEDEWPQLVREYETGGAVDDTSLALPLDFARMVSDTGYEADTYAKLVGSMTPAQWVAARYANPVNIGRVRFRVAYANPNVLKLDVSPSITSVSQAFVFHYITTNTVVDVAGSLKPKFTADSDKSLLPERVLRLGLKWRIKQAKGLDYSEDYNKYEMARRDTLGRQFGAGSIPVAVRMGCSDLTDPYLRETGYGS